MLSDRIKIKKYMRKILDCKIKLSIVTYINIKLYFFIMPVWKLVFIKLKWCKNISLVSLSWFNYALINGPQILVTNLTITHVAHWEDRRKRKCDRGEKTGRNKEDSCFKPVFSPKTSNMLHVSSHCAACLSEENTKT